MVTAYEDHYQLPFDAPSPGGERFSSWASGSKGGKKFYWDPKDYSLVGFMTIYVKKLYTSRAEVGYIAFR